jgi:hypothetical protein
MIRTPTELYYRSPSEQVHLERAGRMVDVGGLGPRFVDSALKGPN